jgi:hypothetical protein
LKLEFDHASIKDDKYLSFLFSFYFEEIMSKISLQRFKAAERRLEEAKMLVDRELEELMRVEAAVSNSEDGDVSMLFGRFSPSLFSIFLTFVKNVFQIQVRTFSSRKKSQRTNSRKNSRAKFKTYFSARNCRRLRSFARFPGLTARRI